MSETKFEVKVDVVQMFTPTILLGPVIGKASLPDGIELEVIGSGNILRFQFLGYKVYYEIDLRQIAEEVVKDFIHGR